MKSFEVYRGLDMLHILSPLSMFFVLPNTPLVLPRSKDGSILRPLSASAEPAAAACLHVPAVLGRHVLQRAAGACLQGLRLQQLLHGHAAGHPVPVHPPRHLHHRLHTPVLRLRTIQVKERGEERRESPIEIIVLNIYKYYII